MGGVPDWGGWGRRPWRGFGLGGRREGVPGGGFGDKGPLGLGGSRPGGGSVSSSPHVEVIDQGLGQAGGGGDGLPAPPLCGDTAVRGGRTPTPPHLNPHTLAVTPAGSRVTSACGAMTSRSTLPATPFGPSRPRFPPATSPSLDGQPRRPMGYAPARPPAVSGGPRHQSDRSPGGRGGVGRHGDGGGGLTLQVPPFALPRLVLLQQPGEHGGPGTAPARPASPDRRVTAT